MKNIFNTIKQISLVASVLLFTACVQEDKFDIPDTNTYQCGDLSQDTSLSLISLENLKKLYDGKKTFDFPKDDNRYIEGYVSSSDHTGNIYKSIFIQDKPENPTQGLTITVDATSTYNHYPQGSKVYIKLAGLSIGEYGGVIQLGVKFGNEKNATSVSRILESDLPKVIIRSCSEKATIVPKVMTLGDMIKGNEQYLGCLVKIENAEFAAKHLCQQFAPTGSSADKQLIDATSSTANKVARMSGYASFALKTIPSGNGDIVGIFSKFNTTYQLYIVDDADLNMNQERIDKIIAPCEASADAVALSVAEVKALLQGNLTQISENATLTALVTANDESGNLAAYNFKDGKQHTGFVYVEDNTGGIKINIASHQQFADRSGTGLFSDQRFQVGRTLTVNLKDLYIGSKNGEIQLGGLYKGEVSRVEDVDKYKHFFRTEKPLINVTPTLKTLPELSINDVGRYIKIKDLQFVSSDLGKTYADGTNTSNRTLEDCAGNTILLRTNGRANFGTNDNKLLASDVEVDTGKGDVTGVLGYYNGKFQLWILNLRGADLDNPRCDGTLPTKDVTLFNEGFENLNDWTAVSIEGDEVWTTTTFGNPKPSAFFDGKKKKNTDWLISKEISLNGFKSAYFSFETDGAFDGNPLKVFVTDNYTGDATTTSWTEITSAVFDTDLSGFKGFVGSGKLSLNNFAGKNIRIAFKYTSENGKSTRWEVDNVIVKANKK